MPLSAKGEEILAALTKEHGAKKAKEILYAGKNSGRFTGIDTEDSFSFTENCFLDGSNVRRTSNGYLVAEPRVARTGIQIYSPMEVGKPEMDRMVKVFRPESEVFSQDTIKSFAHRPVTIDHPPEMVDAGNWKKYSKGHTVDPIVRDGEFVRVPIMLMDQEAVDAFNSGKNQLSMGYTCDLKWEPGVTDDGEEYDAVQTNLRMNHLAIVGNARGGDKLKIGDSYWDRDFTTEQRRKAAKSGAAMPGGEYPIENSADLENAIREIGRGNESHASIRAHIIKRARALGAVGSLPEEWGVKDGEFEDQDYMPCPNCQSSIPVDTEICPDCGYHIPENMVDEEFLEDLLLSVRSGNPNRGPGMRFASAGGGEKKETKIPNKPRSASGINTTKKGLSEKGYSFFGAPPNPIHVWHNGEQISNEPFKTTEEAVLAAHEHHKMINRGGETHSPTENIGSAVKELGSMFKKSGEKVAKTVPEFKSGKHTFATRHEAKQHIWGQRKKWFFARPVKHGATYVARRGFGFTGANIPGFRKQLKPKYYTVDDFRDDLPWTIMFDEEAELLPLTDADLSEIEIVDYNPNHDPQTGEFTSGTTGPALPGQESVKQLAEKSKNEAGVSTFSSPEKAREHINKQLEAWNRHHVTQLEALAEIKRQQAKWKKAKVFVHTKKAPGFFGAKTHHFTVGADSILEVEVTETDLIDARQWAEQMEIDERDSVPATD